MLMPLPTEDVPRQDICSDSRASSCCRDSGDTWRAPAEPELARLVATPHRPRWRGARSGTAPESSLGGSSGMTVGSSASSLTPLRLCGAAPDSAYTVLEVQAAPSGASAGASVSVVFAEVRYGASCRDQASTGKSTEEKAPVCICSFST